MDSQKRDESRDRRREEALARRMGDALDRLERRDSGECPDAELIAAYHEKALQPDEIAQWEGHFAICGRCRKILTVLAAAVEEPLAEREVAHLGALIAAARPLAKTATRPIEIAHPNRLAWHTRWLAPALGVAAVLAVWVAMRPPWRTAEQSPSGTLVAQAPERESPAGTPTRAMQRSSEATPKTSSESDSEALKDRLAARAQSPNPPANEFAKNRVESRATRGLAPSSGVVENDLRDQKKEKAESNGAPASGAFDSLAPAPSAPALRPQAPPPPKTPLVSPREAQVQAAENAPKVMAPPAATTQSVEVTGAAPPASTTGSTAGGAIGSVSARDKQGLTAPAGVDKGAAPPPPPPPPAFPAPVARPPEPLPQEQATAQATTQAPPATETPGSVSQSVTVMEAVPLVETTNSALGGVVDNPRSRADLPLNGRDYQALRKLDVAGELPVEVKTPSGEILWRAGKGGNIQRSADAGRTWISQASPSQEDWLAGTAVSEKICWMVGRNGAIARTTDGGHWKRIAAPPMAADASGKLPDWIEITAAGARKAEITASDQRHYATQDGGKTWKAQ
jgi:hypothetical protein